MTSDKSIIEMPLEQLHDWLCYVRESAILHENDSIQTYTLLKCWYDLVVQ